MTALRIARFGRIKCPDAGGSGFFGAGVGTGRVILVMTQGPPYRSGIDGGSIV